MALNNRKNPRFQPWNSQNQGFSFGAAGQIRTAECLSLRDRRLSQIRSLRSLNVRFAHGSAVRIRGGAKKAAAPDGATAFLELLGRFELPTSSLPTACRVKNTPFYVIFNTFTSKTICSLTLIDPPRPCADFARWVGAWVRTVPPAQRKAPAGAQEYPPEPYPKRSAY